ncbi:NAD-dependent methylenetetrahydrofolate dehydrogenase isoform X2 [Arctopsyche grandis]
MTKILDGKSLSKTLNLELKAEINEWVKKYPKPRLACILVGDDPASVTYVTKKREAAELVGIQCDLIKLNSDVSQSDILQAIHQLNDDVSVDGILVQLPLPESINERMICNAISENKDVDGFSIINVGKFCLDMDALLPCTPYGIMEIIKRNNIETFGRNVVVVGRSKNVAMPIAMLMHTDGKHESQNGMDATVTICHRYTPSDQLANHCRNADIIITATGVPGLIKADMVKPGATIIDVGLTRITCPETGKPKLVGDVDFKEVSKIAGAITPVPGGVGPMTVAMLMRNTFKIARNRSLLSI